MTDDSSIERGAAALDATAAAKPLSDSEAQREVDTAALLEPMAYVRRRMAIAKKIGVPVGQLDKMVVACRKADAGDGGDGGHPFDEVDTWPEPVDGEKLLNDVTEVVHRFVAVDHDLALLCAPWTLLSYLADHATILPILAITSPEKGCGKTTLLALMGKLVNRPILASNITGPALFRGIEKWGPTLLIDEADSFLRNSDELRGILNSGHQRDAAYVYRCVGDEHEPQRFSTWCPKVIASIGTLPDTVQSRSLPVRMRRRAAAERAANLRHADPAPFRELRARAKRWTADNGAAFAVARPSLPEALENRVADNAEPLVAIADLAGGRWPAEMRRVVLLLAEAADDSPSVGEELLCAIQSAFAQWGRDRVSSAQLLKTLHDDPEARWATYEHGRPMTPRQLARKLAAFDIRARVLRIDGRPLRGYEWSQFTDTFARYLPAGDVTTQPVSSDGAPDVTAASAVNVTNATEGDAVTGRTVTQGSPATRPAPTNGARYAVTDDDPVARWGENHPDELHELLEQMEGPRRQ